MAKKKSGNKVWIAGAVLGAVAGAAFALWKTPMSGQELRAKLGTGPAQDDHVDTTRVHTPGMGDKVLGKVEETLAPIVGVKLGKTANDNVVQHRTVVEPVVAAKPAAPVNPPPPAADKRAPGPAPTPEPDVSTRAVERTPPADAGTAASGQFEANSIRARRFAWGDPTPEAGVQPIPADTAAEQISAVRDTEPVPEAVEVATKETEVATSTADTNQSNRFAWGDPAPEAPGDAAGTSGSVTAAVEPVPDAAPLDPATSAAAQPGRNLRQFPKLGGLEK